IEDGIWHVEGNALLVQDCPVHPADFGILVWILDERAALFCADEGRSPLARPDGLDVAESVLELVESELTSWLGPRVEVLVEPAVRRGIEATSLPVRHDDLVAVAVLPGTAAPFLGPQEDESF